MPHNRPNITSRRATPSNVSLVNGMTWGERMSNKARYNKSRIIDPVSYFANTHTKYADTIESMQTMYSGMENASGKSFYMNTPGDSRLKGYLRELGKYDRPMVEGTYNQHENLQEGAKYMMERRIEHGMS